MDNTWLRQSLNIQTTLSPLSPQITSNTALYRQQQNELLATLPQELKGKAQALFQERNRQLGLLSDPVQISGALKKGKEEIAKLTELIASPFMPETLMQLGGASPEEINTARSRFTDIRNKTFQMVVQVKLNALTKDVSDRSISLGFNGEQIHDPVLGEEKTFVSMNLKTGDFFSFAKQSDDAFIAAYAKDYHYLLEGQARTTGELKSFADTITSNNLLNGFEVSTANIGAMFPNAKPEQIQELSARIPNGATVELIPYTFISRKHPDPPQFGTLIGYKTSDGYHIINPNDTRQGDTTTGADKRAALSLLSDVGIGTGCLYLVDGGKTKAIATQYSWAERIQPAQEVLDNPWVIGASLVLAAATFIPTDGASIAIPIGLRALAKTAATAYGTMAGADALANKLDGNLTGYRLASDLSVMALTLLPITGRNAFSKVMMGAKVLGMGVLNKQAIDTIHQIYDNPALSDTQKKKQITTVILMQTFFTLLLAKNVRDVFKVSEMAKQPEIARALEQFGSSSDKVMVLKPEQLKALQERVLETKLNAQGVYEVKLPIEPTLSTNSNTEIARTKVRYTLPVEDVTLMSEQQIWEFGQHKGLSEGEIQSLITLQQRYPQLEQEIRSSFKDKPEIAETLLAFVKNYDASNEDRRIIMEENGVSIVRQAFEEITPSTPQEVTSVEQSLANQTFLYTDNSTRWNIDNGVNRLDRFTEEAMQANPILHSKVNEATRKLVDRNQINELRSVYVADYLPVAKNIIRKIISAVNVNVDGALSSTRVKTLGSLEGKMQPKEQVTPHGDKILKPGKPLGKIIDFIGGRIIVDTYDDIAKVSQYVEANYGDKILEKTNKFIESGSKTAYRGMHYIIKLDDHVCFELQIKTKDELILGEIDHDVVYPEKQYIYQFDKKTRDVVSGYYWGLQAKEIKYLEKQK